MKPKDLKELHTFAKEIYAQNKAVGWWDDPNRCIFTAIQLIITEIAEATEGERKNLMDDHLPHRKMGEVELADALIRTLDVGEHLGLRIWNQHQTPLFLRQLPDPILEPLTIGLQHLAISHAAAEFGSIYKTAFLHPEDDRFRRTLEYAYSRLIFAILWVGSYNHYDVLAAAREKVEYNARRADHKRENRAKEGGKRF